MHKILSGLNGSIILNSNYLTSVLHLMWLKYLNLNQIHNFNIYLICILIKTICHDGYQNAQKKGLEMTKLFVYSRYLIILVAK